MKATKYLSLAALALMCTLASCQSDDEAAVSFARPANAVGINVSVGAMQTTRSNPASTDPDAALIFNQGDQISVSTNDQEAVLFQCTSTENQTWTEAVPNKFLLWTQNMLTFSAYYPVTTGTSMTAFTLPADQSSVENIALADYMTCQKAISRPEGGSDIYINLERKMARVIVKIASFGDQYTDEDEYVKNVRINSQYSAIADGNGTGDVTAVTPYAQGSYDDYTGGWRQNSTFTALVVPGYGDSGARFIQLTDGENSTLEVKGIPELEAGNSYTFNLVVGKNTIQVASVTVQDWTTGETLAGGQAMEDPSVTEVTTFSELKTALSAGKNVKLMNDIECTSETEININGAFIEITSNGALTIDGNGKKLSTTSEIRAFKVGSSATVAFKNLTLTGFVSGGGPAINNSGTIVLDGCTISNCHVNNTNGGGAIENKGKLYAINTTFSSNYSGEIGGAINNYMGSLYMSGCTFTNNYTTQSGAFYGGAIGINGGSEVRLINCSFSENKYGTTTGPSDIGVFNKPTNYTIAGCTGATIASGDGDITTIASGTATLDYSDLSNISFTYYPIYPIALSAVTADYLGSVVGADGKIYANVAAAQAASTTACAIIAYVGSENGEASPYNHGLAIAMKDASAGYLQWKTSKGSNDNTNQYTEPAPAIAAKESGSALSSGRNNSTWPAFEAALANSIDVTDGISAAAPTSGTSGWFLPSLYQWNMIVKGLSGQSADLSWDPNDNYNASILNTKIEAAGGTGLLSFGYWSSSEYDGDYAYSFGAGFGSVNADTKSGYNNVRSAFAL